MTDQYQHMALETWQSNGKEADLEHAVIKLVGEAGEIMDQWGKHRFKPGYECSREDFLDELGDWWYYARILLWLTDTPTEFVKSKIYKIIPKYNHESKAVLEILFGLHANSSKILEYYFHYNIIETDALAEAVNYLSARLDQLNSNLDHLTYLNHEKLKEGHGWIEKSKIPPKEI